MELGELGEPMQEKELLALFSKEGACWMTRKEMVLWRGQLGICGLVRVPAVPVSKDLPEAGEYAPFRSGLFRPLRSPAYEGSWSAQGCLLQRVREEEAAGRKKELLTCFLGEEAGGEGAVVPVSEQRRQEKKGEAAT